MATVTGGTVETDGDAREAYGGAASRSSARGLTAQSTASVWTKREAEQVYAPAVSIYSLHIGG